MYYKVLDIADWVFLGAMGVSLVLLIYKIFYHIYALFPDKHFPPAQKLHKFAILVPARNESKVIDGLLQSLATCDYPQDHFDVYVIVEDAHDPTWQICQKYPGVTCFVRPDLAVKTKGGALDQMVKHLIQTGIAQDKGYEAYFIFDADNQVSKTYLSEMNKVYDAGYDIALGYRNALNWNDGWIASCSALTFTMLNTFQNKCRARFAQNVLVQGTGFYICARVINALGGWPFQTLTEDVEISYYAALNNLKGAYNSDAEFWDEQPVSLRISCNQRLRWVKGYGQVNHQYHKKMVKSLFATKTQRLGKLDFALNIVPVAVPLASIVIYLLFTLTMGIVGLVLGVPAAWWQLAFTNFGLTLLGSYLFFLLYAVMLLAAERKHSNITTANAVKACLMFPFYMALYLPIVVVAVFKKKVVWTKITRKNELAAPTKE